MQEFYIDSDGVRIHSKLQMPEGKKKCPLVIVVHGFTGHMEEDHIRAVADCANRAGFASLRVEMYGHGQSDGKFEDHTILKWINNMIDVVDYARKLDFVTDMYLAGHSQGGLLTVLMGGIMPDVFKAIIPLSPAVMIPAGARYGNLLGIQFDKDNVPEVFDAFGLRLKGNYVRVARFIEVDDYIRMYDKPVLIVHGDKDEAVPVEFAHKTAALYKNCQLSIIEGADHCFVGQIDEMIKPVEDFLRSIDKE